MITNEVGPCIRDSHFLIVEKTADKFPAAIEFSLIRARKGQHSRAALPTLHPLPRGLAVVF